MGQKIRLSDKFDNLLADIQSNSFNEQVENISVVNIVRGQYQPRKQFDETALTELSMSIKENGILQPILVRRAADGKYEIIAGERRWQASKKIGLKFVPALIKQVDDEVAATFSLIENLQRADLTPLEEALSYGRLITDFSFTHEEIAQRVGRSRPSISNALRLLDLSSEVKKELSDHHIEMGHARALAGLSEEEQSRAVKEVVQKKLNVRETEKLVKHFVEPVFHEEKNYREVNKSLLAHYEAEINQRFQNSCDLKIEFNKQKEGKGRLIFGFNNTDELDKLLADLEAFMGKNGH